ncbi:MAG: heme biosynthesis protein HemY, partial [Rhodospirillaceae bacterium]|nr:heme biosynthesis protein HemY [Rhodospirillaceae bacterium]
DGLLREPPLTMLLSAQAAQLDGDEAAAETFFTEMLDRPDMEFLGLRGLLGQAVKRNDQTAALKLVRRASRLQPKSDWVTRTLFDQEARAGNWAKADAALNSALANKMLPEAEAVGHKAVLALLQSVDAEKDGNPVEAMKLAKLAHGEDTSLVPAACQYSRLLTGMGKRSKASGVIETTWARQPHPDLAAAYWHTKDEEDALARMKHAETLAAKNSGDDASRLLLAGAAIEAGLWGVARENLDDLPVTQAQCRLMAALCEGEKDDKAAHEWLVRAAIAEPDATWVCSDCGNLTDAWSALCGKCGNFNSFDWQRPSSIPGIAAPQHETVPLLGADTVIDGDGPEQ